jgi:hypothetical protein
MLKDFRATKLRYDAGTDVAKLEVAEWAGGETRKLSALLLLDADGFLVGVDLEGEPLGRAVVLLGAYENVDRTVPAEVVVGYDAGGEPAVVSVRGAKGAIRAEDKNPYV